MPEEVGAIARSRLSMDELIREKVHRSFTFRAASVADYSTALAVESWPKSGALWTAGHRD